MDLLLERLRAALAPRYTVQRPLGSGGMGAVYLGHDAELGRPVAIKVIRPELASAQAVERFLREARTLAGFSHPNIVHVLDVKEADGLPCYFMEYLEGETLADRLARSPLPWWEVLKLGRDLLDGLEAAHRRDVIHRDVKPANVFLLDKRAVLVDFGIAKSLGTGRTQLTGPGELFGTPDYMPPEQLAGAATIQTDLYAVGMVLYEALTGRQWSMLDRPERADWSRIPRGIARVLRRALQWDPADRWPDAASFRHALWRKRVWPYRLRTMALTAAGVIVGVVAAIWLWPRIRDWLGGADEPRVAFCVGVEPFERGLPEEHSWLGDSLAHALARRLSGYVDFAVAGPGRECHPGEAPASAVAGTVTTAGDTFRAVARLAGGPAVTTAGELGRWREAVDGLADGLIVQILRSPLDSALPAGVLPKSPLGMAAFLRAERLFAEARWAEAGRAYEEAETVDSTCYLCSWRRAEVDRWMVPDPEARRAPRYLAHLDVFPARYRSLIRAMHSPVRARIDTLREVTRLWPRFFLGWFLLGDELYHRGPLVGHARREAIQALWRTVTERRDFAPAWEHLAWALAAEGDSAGAHAARDSLTRLRGPEKMRDPSALGIEALLAVGLAWRFQPRAVALQVTRGALREPAILRLPELAAGPRYLPSLGAPHGAVEFGRVLAEELGRPDLVPHGLLAQLFGYLALGQPDSARLLARRLRDRTQAPDAALFVAELDGALALLDGDAGAVRAAWLELRQPLREYAELPTGSVAVRRRAAWMYTLLAREAGERAERDRYAPLLTGEPLPSPLRGSLAADAAARGGRLVEALRQSEALTELWADTLSARAPADPFFRAVLHLRRADWQLESGRAEHARAELLWHQNLDEHGRPRAEPQMMEADWAFGTLASWRRARLLDASDRSAEACAAYSEVERLWAGGEPRYRARADSAVARLEALGCRSAAP